MSRKLSDILDFMIPQQAVHVHVQRSMSEGLNPVFSGVVGQLRFNDDFRAILGGKIFAMVADNSAMRIYVYPIY